ncbi:MAG: DUF1501 domain-containing protein [Planctomycetota bacterium]|nr:MAG: DUF1501 domain-containing protein [Planctomycetota bacterium]
MPMVSRRDFVQVGFCGLGGVTLPLWLRLRAEAARQGRSYVRDKAVVLLFLSGGPSHIETFNPNMDAPSPYCSATGEVTTSVPGMAFGGTFPRLARLADRMAVIRSFQHPIGGHVQAIVHVLSGGTSPDGDGAEGFSIGSAVARLHGRSDLQTGMPTYALLNSEEVDPQYRNERGRVVRGSAPGELGTAYGPFVPTGDGPLREAMSLRLSAERFAERRRLLASLDRLRRTADATGALEGADRFTQQAFDLILGSAAEAFDFSREDPRWLARYDTSHIRVGKKRFRPSDLGRLMLAARRLVESGCRFVTVHSAGWDMHADSNNPGIVAGMRMLGPTVDIAVSAFLEDLQSRGLSDDVLLIITGDFGRTPRINPRGGRDHWPRLCTLAFAGGGLPTGQVVGRSGRRNDEPDSEPITPKHLAATVLHVMFDVGTLRVARGIPRSLQRLIEQAAPIRELV